MTDHPHPLTPIQLLSFMRAQPWAVEASVTPDGAPQAAVIGVAVTDRWELLFDTQTGSRKHQNLVRNPRVAFVVGWEHERTVQYEGIAALPSATELPDVQADYFDRFPDVLAGAADVDPLQRFSGDPADHPGVGCGRDCRLADRRECRRGLNPVHGSSGRSMNWM
jgi:hypothetical protein